MNAEIRLQWTEDLLVRAQEQFLRSLGMRRRWWSWITLGVSFPLFLVLVVFSPAHYLTWLLAALAVLSLAQLFLSPWLRRRRIRAGFRKFGEYTQTYIITDDALQVKNPYAQGAMPWSKLEKLCRFDDMWLLFLTKATYYILPVDEMKGEVGEFIIGKVRENGGKVK
jgi:hypothetical protein